MKPRQLDTASKRIISRIIEINYGNEQKGNIDLIEKIDRLYYKHNGSWKLFFEGHPTHNKLLKMCIKLVLKQRELAKNGKPTK